MCSSENNPPFLLCLLHRWAPLPALGLVPEVTPEPPPSHPDGQRRKRGQYPQTANDLASRGPGLIFKKQLKVQVGFGRVCSLCLLWLIISGEQTSLEAGREINIRASALPPGEAMGLPAQSCPKEVTACLHPHVLQCSRGASGVNNPDAIVWPRASFTGGLYSH